MSAGAVYLEVGALWLITLVLIRAALALQRGAGLPDWVLAVVPLLFIYAPVLLCRWRGADSWSYRLSIPAFSDLRSWKNAAILAAGMSAVVLVPWLVGYHLYRGMFPHLVRFANRIWLNGVVNPDLLAPIFTDFAGMVTSVAPDPSKLPADLLTLVAYQVFFVAIPEEFFYRGYLQTRLNEVHRRRFRVLGVQLGMGAIVANLLFAFGHSVVQLQWWHFATFFPGLLFAWARERSGGVVPGALFHACCNVSVITLDSLYGVV